jgi:hypothetical protein
MAHVFGLRTLVYWWAALSATAFLKDWLGNMATAIQSSDLFSAERFPFNLIPNFNGWIDHAAEYVREAVRFKPEQELVAVGPIHVPSWAAAVVFALALAWLVAALYLRSLRSRTWHDDLVAILAAYVILRVEGHIIAAARLPIQEQFRMFVNDPAVAFIILVILVLSLILLGHGLRSPRAFLKACLEIVLLALFMFPRNTAFVLSLALRYLSQFGTSLSQFTPLTISWGVLGIFLAWQRFMRRARVPIRRY